MPSLDSLALWEKCSPCPVVSTANAFFINSDKVSDEVLYINSSTTALSYSPINNSWNYIPSPGLAGTFGPGSCGVWHNRSFTITAQTGTGGTSWGDNSDSGYQGTTIKTNLTILTNLTKLGGYEDDGQFIGRINSYGGTILTGSLAGLSVTICGNTVGANSSIYVVNSDGYDISTLAAGATIEFYTGRFYVLNAGTIGAGSFKYFDHATQVWSGNLSVNNLPATWGTSGVLESMFDPLPNEANRSFSIYATGTTTRADITVNGTLVANSLIGCELFSYSQTSNGGQSRSIVSNTSSSITVSTPFSSAIVSGDYAVRPNSDILYLIGNNAVTMYSYTISTDTWAVITPVTERAGVPSSGSSLFKIKKSLNLGDFVLNGKALYSFRATENILDRYSIAANAWTTISYGRDFENFSRGSGWCSTGTDDMYCQINPVVNEYPRIVKYSNKYKAMGALPAIPYILGTVFNGVRIFKLDGIINSYIYYLMPSSSKMYRLAL